MNGLELNKIAASILVAGLIAMIAGSVAEILYHPEEPEKRGYAIDVPENAGAEVAQAKEISVAELMSKADADSGAQQAKKCAACHNLEKGGPNLVGPNLWGVLGRDKGSHAGFQYSDAMLALEGNWDYDSLFHFIHKPREYVKGTKMNFIGISDPQKVADVVAFLRQHNDNPPPLPEYVPQVEEPSAGDEAPAAETPALNEESKDATNAEAPVVATEEAPAADETAQMPSEAAIEPAAGGAENATAKGAEDTKNDAISNAPVRTQPDQGAENRDIQDDNPDSGTSE